jgi:hypothetical protein
MNKSFSSAIHAHPIIAQQPFDMQDRVGYVWIDAAQLLRKSRRLDPGIAD